MLKTPTEYGYVMENNLCLFTKGPLSQWWGGFKDQDGGFKVNHTVIFNLFNAKKDQTARWLKEHENPILGWNTELEFNCCEQFMMFCKAALHNDYDMMTKIMEESHPQQQKALGRSISNWDEDLYKQHRLRVVKAANVYKFSQNLELKEWFISNFHPQTVFVEAAPWDKVWGIGLAATDEKAKHMATWEGLNLLGESLQHARRTVEKDWERVQL